MELVIDRWEAVLITVPDSGFYLACWFGGAFLWFLGSLWLAHLEGLPLLRVALILCVTVLVAAVGARTHALLSEAGFVWSDIFARPEMLLEPGWRLPGGLILVLLVAPVVAWILRVPLLPLADVATPLVGVVFAVGRIGCLDRGCCHGVVSALPWSIRFDRGSEAYANHIAQGLISPGAEASLAVHPLQLYLALGGLLTTVLLLMFRPHRRYVGELALVGIGMRGWLMVVGEAFRESMHVPPVPFRQAIPLFTATLSSVVWLMLWLRGVRDAVGSPDSRNVFHHRIPDSGKGEYYGV